MLKLLQTSLGRFDLAFGEPAKQDRLAKAATIVYASIFTDAEAPLSRVDRDAYDRRGYYADPKAGSGCWHVRRQVLTRNARIEAISEVKRALQRHQSGLSDISVAEASGSARNPTGVVLDISAAYAGENVLVKVSL